LTRSGVAFNGGLPHRPSDSGSGVTGATNQLLDALPVAEAERLARLLRPIFLDVTSVLFEPERVIDAVYFPRNCVVSLVTPLHDGAFVEVASVGNEGIVGVPLVPGNSLAIRAVCSVEGWADRLDASAFLEEVERSAPLRDLVRDYVQALFGQIAVAAACNRLHSTDQRVARWLLMSRDRVDTDEFVVTHGFLSRMLGVRRATVTRSAGLLQAAGLITYRRGKVRILDRAGLESVACECYAMVERELDGVVQRAGRHAARGRAVSLQAIDAVVQSGEVEIQGAAVKHSPASGVRPWGHGGAADAVE
jgi:CRP-like cAMP-binding protein